MLPKTFLTQLLPPRAGTAARRLEKQIWTRVAGPLPVTQSKSTVQHRDMREVAKSEFKPIKRLPHVWGRVHDQCWWRVQIDLPVATRKGKDTLYLDWQDQAEATVYAGGMPWHGIDPGHRIVPLPAAAKDLVIESACIRSGVWVANEDQGLSEEGSVFQGAFLCTRDDAAWEASITLTVLLEILQREYNLHATEPRTITNGFSYLPSMEKTTPLFRRLVRRLDAAVDILDTRGVNPFLRELKAIIKAFPSEPNAMRCILTGHAHIDLVWLWPERVGEFKAVHTFSTINRLMESYPELVFGYSQPASYEAVRRRSPTLMAAVRKRISQRRWEPVGATYVESDTQLACGENLIRSFLLGQKGYRDLTGKPSSILWIPDVFGYTGCLPQIMRQTDVTRFFTTKLTWGNISRFPHSSFRWIGNDGSEVLVHVTQAYGYNGTVSAEEIDRGQLNYRQADVHDAFLAPTGYGDGGGGVTEEMCLRARVLSNFSGTPRTQWGRVDTFFDELDQVRPTLPAYQGELYLEYHRGVHTTHGDLKAAFRAAERGLQTWEAARCAVGGGAIDEHAWKRVVFAQFHDYIPGSSIHEVQAEAVPELNGIARRGAREAAADLASAGSGNRRAALFNPLPYPQLAYDAAKSVWRRVPPLAGAPVAELEAIESPGAVTATTSRLKNDRVDARFDRRGRITRLIIDGARVPFTAPAGELVLYPDFPAAYDAWDIDRNTLANPQPVATPPEVAISTEEDGHAADVAFSRPLGTHSRITTHYRLEAPDGVLRISYSIDWKDRSTLLKVVFPTDYNGRHARYGAPLGSALRVQQPARPDDEAQFENPFSRWLCVGEDSGAEGFFAASEAKYGASLFQGSVQISLVRSARVVDSEKSPNIRPVDVSEPFSDLMPHEVSLAIGRVHAATPREEQPAALADRVFTAPITYKGGAVCAGFLGLEGGETFQPCWAKPAEANDGSWILRCHETDGRRDRVKLSLAPGYSAESVDLMERPLAKRVSTDGRLTFGPYELVSFLIQRGD